MLAVLFVYMLAPEDEGLGPPDARPVPAFAPAPLPPPCDETVIALNMPLPPPPPPLPPPEALAMGRCCCVLPDDAAVLDAPCCAPALPTLPPPSFPVLPALSPRPLLTARLDWAKGLLVDRGFDPLPLALPAGALPPLAPAPGNAAFGLDAGGPADAVADAAVPDELGPAPAPPLPTLAPASAVDAAEDALRGVRKLSGLARGSGCPPSFIGVVVVTTSWSNRARACKAGTREKDR